MTFNGCLKQLQITYHLSEEDAFEIMNANNTETTEKDDEIVYVVDQGRGTQLGCAILPHHDGVCHTLHDNTQLAHHNGQAKEGDCLDM